MTHKAILFVCDEVAYDFDTVTGSIGLSIDASGVEVDECFGLYGKACGVDLRKGWLNGGTATADRIGGKVVTAYARRVCSKIQRVLIHAVRAVNSWNRSVWFS